jgi:cobyrinic acid a,c-diamide synthase
VNYMNAIVIAAPSSGSGKTTVTLGIMACLKKRGLNIAPFKAGPDFIDPGWHRLATGRPSINLDGWICPEGFIRQTFALHAKAADFVVIEGVMGLFDGIGGESDSGSTAQLAKILDIPVILVVDAKSQARSAAALVQGFARFDRDIHVTGIIFNNVGSDNHARILRQAVESSVPDITVLGFIPRDERLQIPSRHLGLVTAVENPLQETFLENLSNIVEKHVDLDKLLSTVGQIGNFHKLDVKSVDTTPDKERIAVAHDKAFCFVYEDNLRLLREAGAETVEFSPLSDSSLPAAISGIYLPGGYPELFADTLAGNDAIKSEIKAAIESGMPVYAECGGFIYLTGGTRGDMLNEFVGVFPVLTRMLSRRKALGYREVELRSDSPIGPKGMIARGHEFHYSEMEEMPASVQRVYRVRKNGVELGTEGYRYKNCIASYVHLHFGSCPEIAATFVESCRKFTDKDRK